MNSKTSNRIAFLLLVLTAFGQGEARILFQELFDNNNFIYRRWAGQSKPMTVSTAEHVPGSPGSLEFHWTQGNTGPDCGGMFHKFSETESVYISFYLKFSPNWVGSGVAYHPHMIHVMTTMDMATGFASSKLNTYIEVVNGYLKFSLQDSKNIDYNCITANGGFIGCNGNPATYPFTENRSIASCNGIMGDLDGRDCFDAGGGSYYSSRQWSGRIKHFSDAAGSYYKADWHFVEIVLKLNTISGGKGQVDGVLRYWFDGEPVFSYDHMIYRTAVYPDMRFDKFVFAPHIGPGSPVDQTFWIDNLTIAKWRQPVYPVCPDSVVVAKGAAFGYKVRSTAALGGTVTLTYFDKPSWITAAGDTLFGTAPNIAQIDTVRVKLTVGSFSDTLTLRIYVGGPVGLPFMSGQNAGEPGLRLIRAAGKESRFELRDSPAGDYTLKVLDTSGRILRSLQGRGQETGTVSVSIRQDLRPGLYLVVLQQKGSRQAVWKFTIF